MIRTQNLFRQFGGHTAVDNLSLDIGEGEIFGLLGPNGAGKTTTVRMLTTLLRPGSGSASVAGFDVATQPIGIWHSAVLLAYGLCCLAWAEYSIRRSLK